MSKNLRNKLQSGIDLYSFKALNEIVAEDFLKKNLEKVDLISCETSATMQCPALFSLINIFNKKSKCCLLQLW